MGSMTKLTVGFAMVFGISFGAKAQSIVSFHDLHVECIGMQPDGSQTLRSTGTGKTRADAVKQAKKNAVWAVIFDGIYEGKSGCDMRPLLCEANAREKYEDYFNIFFADGGDYKEYVSTEDEKRHSREKSQNKYYKKYTVTVRVLRNELKSRLKQDNILK